MGQDEIVDFLVDKRATGVDKYFTTTEIRKAINGSNSTGKQIRQLIKFGIVECKRIDWRSHHVRISDKVYNRLIKVKDGK